MSDVVVALIGAVAAITCVALPIYRSHDKKLSRIGEQVMNSHPSNLREDLDQVMAGIGRLVEGQGIQSLDLAWIRREMSDHGHRLTRLENRA